MAGTLKDSKTRWLGQIPTDWDMVRVKDCFDRKNKKANQKNPIVLSLTRSGVKIRDITSNEGQLAADYTNYNPVAKDDILINPMDLVSGDNCNISKVEGVISPAYVNLRYKKGINPRFYNYYFKLQYWLGAFFAHGYGVSFDNRWTLSYEALSKYPIVLPPSEEQDKIADFLDEKCAEIDKLSEDIQKQIDILNDYKKSVITRAVTKGLDPNAEMKDSGVEWIKQVPSTWSEHRLENLVDSRFSGAWGDDVKGNDYDRICMRIADFDYSRMRFKAREAEYYTKRNYSKAEIAKKTLKRGDILIEKSGGGEKTPVGRAVIYDLDNHAIFANFMECIRINDLSTANFVKYYLFCSYSHGVTNLYFNQTTGIQNLNIARYLKESKIFLPDNGEQKYLCDYLEIKCTEIDDSIVNKQRQLQNLDNYKKSIIYEYVTGKKRVKGAL